MEIPHSLLAKLYCRGKQWHHDGVMKSIEFSAGSVYFLSQEVCVMKFLCAIVLLLAFTSLSSAQSPNTWKGFVTDTHCGTNCQRTSTMTPDKACVRRCVKNGSKYGLWFGDHVYVLEPQSEAAKFAAENVRVTGDFSNDTIHIQSIVRISSQASQGQKPPQ